MDIEEAKQWVEAASELDILVYFYGNGWQVTLQTIRYVDDPWQCQLYLDREMLNPRPVLLVVTKAKTCEGAIRRAAQQAIEEYKKWT